MAYDPIPLSEDETFDASIYVPKFGTTVLPADVTIGEQALANRTKFLNATKFDKAGGNITGGVTLTAGALTLAPGTTLSSSATAAFNGAVTFGNIVSVNAAMTVQSGGSFTLASGASSSLAGSTTRSGPMTLSGDGATSSWRGQDINPAAPSATISVDRDFYHVTSPSAGATTYTLESTPTPPAYAMLEVAVYGLPNAATLVFVREDATVIASLLGGSATTQTVLRFRFVTDPGEWRLMSYFTDGVTVTVGDWNG